MARLVGVSERFLVTGGGTLTGEVHVGGAKNSVLKLMAATLLAEGTSTITNCPDILDVPLMAEVLRGLGCEVVLDHDIAHITTPAEPKYHADFAAVRQFRASVCVLGPLVARCKRAVVALPGGDAIGSRPLDMHQSGLRLLGAHSEIEHGCVVARADELRGARSGSTSRRSGRPRTSSWRRCSPRARPSSTTPPANPRSSTCATCWCRWGHGSAAPARQR